MNVQILKMHNHLVNPRPLQDDHANSGDAQSSRDNLVLFKLETSDLQFLPGTRRVPPNID